MIPEPSTNSFAISTDAFPVRNFGIDDDDFRHIIGILQNQLYSNKILAILREYSTNQSDAHVEAGIAHVPVKITLPAQLSSQLIFRDFGNGLTKEQIETVFTRYGKSTKRGTNTATGQFGIGGKVAFCYTSSFLVRSYIAGQVTTWSCILDESNVGTLVNLGECETTEPNGLEIIIDVKKGDISNFRDEAREFFKFWPLTPDIEGFDASDYEGMRASMVPHLEGTKWKILKRLDSGYGESNILMGNVAYKIDWDAIRDFDEFCRNRTSYGRIRNFISNNNILFTCEIGQVQPTPSREALQYTENTNALLLSKLETLLLEIKGELQDQFSGLANIFEAKRLYHNLFVGDAYMAQLSGITLEWQGEAITNNLIGPFYDDVEYPHVFLTYIKWRRSGRYQLHVATKYGNNTISCMDNTVILEVDMPITVAMKRVVNYLAAIKSNADKVYVLSFANPQQRDEIFAKFHLDDAFIIKYSSIRDLFERAKRVPSLGPYHARPRVAVDLRNYNLPYLDRLYFVTSTTRINMLPVQQVDLSAGGIYILASACHTGCGDLVKMSKDLQALYEIGGSVDKVYVLKTNAAKRIQKLSNWVKYEDYRKAKLDYAIAHNPEVPVMVAMNQIVMDDKVNGWSPQLNSIIDGGTNVNPKILAARNLFKQVNGVLHEYLSELMVPDRAIMDNLLAQFAELRKAYPALEFIDTSLAFMARHDKHTLLPWLKSTDILEYLK
jgi:hypothetical protein